MADWEWEARKLQFGRRNEERGEAKAARQGERQIIPGCYAASPPLVVCSLLMSFVVVFFLLFIHLLLLFGGLGGRGGVKKQI